jgi:hypothetical protein
MMHNLSKWILRVMIVLGAIGFTAVYVNRNGWTIAEAPPIFNGPAPAPAPVFVPAYAPAVGGATTSFAPCQPIGRTARGELVYSMDCQQVPASSGATAAPAASDDGDKK